MNAMIRKAIELHTELNFFYKGSKRVVEPHTYGQVSSGKDAICGWQVSGGSGVGFRLFILDEISTLEFGDKFDGYRPGYSRRDQQFRSIYAEL